MLVNSSYLPGSQKSLKWAPEAIMLFWELLQCNKKFRASIIESRRANELAILVVYYAMEYRANQSKQGVVRMCVLVLQTLSAEAQFGQGLNQKFESQDALPASIRLQGFNGSYADFVIIVWRPVLAGILKLTILVNTHAHHRQPRKT